MVQEGVVAVTCNTCGMFVFLPEDMNNYTCSKCKLVVLLEEKVQCLEERVSALRLIREHESFIDSVGQTLLGGQQTGDVLMEGQSRNATGPELKMEVVEQDHSSHRPVSGCWKNVTHRSKWNREHEGNREHLAMMSLKLENKYQVLSPSGDQEEGVREHLGQSLVKPQVTLVESENVIPLAKPQKRRVVVVGDSLLRGTETVICRSDKLSREVCCLPGAKIHHVTERLPRLIKPTDNHPVLLVHVGTNDTARRRFQDIVRDFEKLGKKAKDLKTKLVISSLLPVVGHGPRREEKIVEVNKWLREWCGRERFCFLDHGWWFQRGGLLARDGLHLTAVGKNIFARRLENVIRRELN